METLCSIQTKLMCYTKFVKVFMKEHNFLMKGKYEFEYLNGGCQRFPLVLQCFQKHSTLRAIKNHSCMV